MSTHIRTLNETSMDRRIRCQGLAFARPTRLSCECPGHGERMARHEARVQSHLARLEVDRPPPRTPEEKAAHQRSYSKKRYQAIARSLKRRKAHA